MYMYMYLCICTCNTCHTLTRTCTCTCIGLVALRSEEVLELMAEDYSQKYREYITVVQEREFQATLRRKTLESKRMALLVRSSPPNCTGLYTCMCIHCMYRVKGRLKGREREGERERERETCDEFLNMYVFVDKHTRVYVHVSACCRLTVKM